MDPSSALEHNISRIAAAIGEPARTRMLYALLDGHARTSTELSIIADVCPSTGSVHLQRLIAGNLITLNVQGRHRYYSLAGEEVATALERLCVLAGNPQKPLVTSAPSTMRVARTCYDHMAGVVGVALHDRLKEMGWIHTPTAMKKDYDVTAKGALEFGRLGIDVEALRSQRRRFVGPCLDWSERKPHLAGSVGAALLRLALKRKWVCRQLDSRALDVTRFGRGELESQFGIKICDS